MKLYAIMISLIVLTGCTSALENKPVRPVVIQSEPIDRPELVLPSIDRVTQRPFEWKAVTPDNAQELWDELNRTGQPVVVFGLTEQGYEALSLNTADALKIIIQQQTVIDAYREYYITMEKTIDDHNAR